MLKVRVSEGEDCSAVKKENQKMSENSSFAQVCIARFDGDFDHWSLLMENLLRSKEY